MTYFRAPMRRIGKYELVRQLATGGMGEVFLARQLGPAGFSREVVIKRLLPHVASDQTFVDLFLNEARLAAQLSHPNVVHVIELAEEAGMYLLVMEYVPGKTLAQLHGALASRNQRLSPELVAFIGTQILAGLDHAHTLRSSAGLALGIVHRDVSADNVLVSFNGQVKLLDFGIAKAMAAVNARTGAIRGKPKYMAPEQLRGESVGPGADLYATSVLLYFLLAGRKPFSEASIEALIHSVPSKDPPPLGPLAPDVPRQLEAIIMRGLSKDAAARFASAADMAAALHDHLRGSRQQPTSAPMAALVAGLFGVERAPAQPAGSADPGAATNLVPVRTSRLGEAPPGPPQKSGDHRRRRLPLPASSSPAARGRARTLRSPRRDLC
jgi:serine/threonine protein kinase